jgi:elongation factor Ts
MAEITAELVKQLREATNVSMMECKRALVDAAGDMEKATRLLRERGMGVAAKKASRATNSGLIASSMAPNGAVTSLVEVNCETDFVARNENFKAFVAEVATQACGSDAPVADVVKDRLTAKIAEIGENMVARRSVRFVLQGKGRLANYIHLGGKVGVLVEVGCEKDASVASPVLADLAKDLTLQIAASSPRFVRPEDVDAKTLTAEREIYAAQVKDKPAQVVEKIVDGKVKKFYTEVCLLEQPYVREPKTFVKQVVEAKAKELGDKLTVRRFVRYQLGE